MLRSLKRRLRRVYRDEVMPRAVFEETLTHMAPALIQTRSLREPGIFAHEFVACWSRLSDAGAGSGRLRDLLREDSQYHRIWKHYYPVSCRRDQLKIQMDQSQDLSTKTAD